jgi:hypothetical protein
MTSPHISRLKHGLHTQTALVGSVVVGRVALEGDLWTWHASLPLEAVDRTVSTVNERPRGDEVIGQRCSPLRPLSRTCE